MVMDKWKYEKVLVVMQNPHPRQWLVEEAKNDDRIIIVTDDKFDQMMKEKYYSTFHSNGILCTRIMVLPDTKLALLNKLIPIVRKIEGKEPKDLIDVRKIVKTYWGGQGKDSIAYQTQKLSWYPKKADVEYPSSSTTNRTIHPIPTYTPTDPKVFTNIIKEEEKEVIACLGYLKELVDSGRHTLQSSIFDDYWALRKALNRSKRFRLLPLPKEYEQGYIFYNPSKVSEEEAFKVAKRNKYLKRHHIDKPFTISGTVYDEWNKRHPNDLRMKR